MTEPEHVWLIGCKTEKTARSLISGFKNKSYRLEMQTLRLMKDEVRYYVVKEADVEMLKSTRKYQLVD